MTDLYAGLNLHRGNNNAHVKDLQRDLHELGFQIVGAIDGGFGRRTAWGVREFQTYSRMARVAREDTTSSASRYVDRLSAVDTGARRYTGPISGVVNPATRAAIQHWLEQGWRCPVVIEGWSIQGGRPHTLRAANVWWHDEIVNKALRVYARDFSGYYDLPEGQNEDELIVLGDYATYLDWSGPRSVPPRHTRPEGELLPESLIGAGLADLTAFQRSTYKVVRAVSEVECIGYFDSLNAYDNAFMSLGPCHWTLGIVNRNRSVSDGELCAYLGYLEHADPDAFQKAFGFFGVRIDRSWVSSSGVANGKHFFNSAQHKYAGWLSIEQEDGSFERLAKSENEANCLKSWHWFYRFAMAGRTIAGYRRRMWDMARIRLRDIRDTPWGSGVESVPVSGALPRPVTVGDVFTSERALAILLRWHVRFPAHMVIGGLAGSRLKGALERARGDRPDLDWDDNPTTWTNAHEAALLQGLRGEVADVGNQNLADTIASVDAWPKWAGGSNPRRYKLSPDIGSLAEGRNSLDFDASGLPPAP